MLNNKVHFLNQEEKITMRELPATNATKLFNWFLIPLVFWFNFISITMHAQTNHCGAIQPDSARSQFLQESYDN